MISACLVGVGVRLLRRKPWSVVSGLKRPTSICERPHINTDVMWRTPVTDLAQARLMMVFMASLHRVANLTRHTHKTNHMHLKRFQTTVSWKSINCECKVVGFKCSWNSVVLSRLYYSDVMCKCDSCSGLESLMVLWGVLSMTEGLGVHGLPLE